VESALIRFSKREYWKENSFSEPLPTCVVWPTRRERYLLVRVPRESGVACGLAPYVSVFFW
jgi:hypothetical protein